MPSLPEPRRLATAQLRNCATAQLRKGDRGTGRSAQVYLHAVVDTLGSHAFGLLHGSKPPVAAAAALHNDELPFFRNLDLPGKAVLSERAIEGAIGSRGGPQDPDPRLGLPPTGARTDSVAGKRKNHSAEFKAKVVLQAIRGDVVLPPFDRTLRRVRSELR